MYVHVCLLVIMCTMCLQCPQGPEEGTRSLGTVVTGDCDSFNNVAPLQKNVLLTVEASLSCSISVSACVTSYNTWWLRVDTWVVKYIMSILVTQGCHVACNAGGLPESRPHSVLSASASEQSDTPGLRPPHLCVSGIFWMLLVCKCIYMDI